MKWPIEARRVNNIKIKSNNKLANHFTKLATYAGMMENVIE